MRALHMPSPKTWARIHGGLTLTWVLLIVPSLLFWRESVPWLVFMSAYANIAGSAASWQSARADANSPDLRDLDKANARLVELLRRVPERPLR